jgi:hypothetical protein
MMTRIAREKRRRSEAKTYAPAYWLTGDQAIGASEYIEREDVSRLMAMMGEGSEVPRSSEAISMPLIGELVNLLAQENIAIPQGKRVENAIVFMIGREEASAMRASIEHFIAEALDEDLAEADSFVLYVGETELVRRGLEYLTRAMAILDGYQSVVIFVR